MRVLRAKEPQWKVEVDRASNSQRAGAGLVITSPIDEIVQAAIRLNFEATNNETEYEALILGIESTVSLGARNLLIISDSQLIVNQILGEYEAKTTRMVEYLAKARALLVELEEYEIQQKPRDQNKAVDALSTLASMTKTTRRHLVWIEVLDHPSIEVYATKEEEADMGWMIPILKFLEEGSLPKDRKKAKEIRLKAARFWLSPDGILYRKSFTGQYLRCVPPEKVASLLYEIHKGICGLHVGGRNLAFQAIT